VFSKTLEIRKMSPDEDARGKVISQRRKKYPSSWYLEKNNYRAETKGSRENR
jgi:hypothetical protein